MKQNVLEVKNLVKQFGNFRAVNNVSFALGDGEILGLLGRNGAGKTTTMQMLLGVLTPTSGTISYFGKPFKNHREEILQRVNFSSTYTNLPDKLSVIECLKFLSYLYSVKNKKEQIDMITKRFHLEELLNKQIHQLSAGQKTRVNLAKAFLNSPKILLLDEPTASLDPDIALYIREMLLKERKDLGVSIIITSHNMGEVEELCDRVIFIDRGEIIDDDTPENLAKSIETAHVELHIKDGLKRTVDFSKKKKLQYKLEGRSIIVDVNEREVAQFLRDLMDAGIFYDEISIEKPSLEDYFLQAGKKKTKKEVKSN